MPLYNEGSQTVDIAAYLDALEIELGQLPKDFRPETIYLGGGTPTSLSSTALNTLLNLIHKYVGLDAVQEWTCEVNPGTLDADKAGVLRQAGVNRVSLGVQSFDENTLRWLKRIHSVADAYKANTLLRENGIHNISMDLMYGLPSTGMIQLQKDLQALIDIKPEHISCYCLSYEEGTSLTRLRDAGVIDECSDDELSRVYFIIRQQLMSMGYHHYEISNFAKPGYECQHNLLYWGEGEYIGCGPAAWSYYDGTRYGNPELKSWILALEDGHAMDREQDTLDNEARACELLVMWLRRLDGVPRALFQQQTGYDYHALKGDVIRSFCRDGYLVESEGVLRLSEEMLFVSDRIFSELV